MPDWTHDQLTAICQTEGDLLVSASAGTGKTAVLVQRIVGLVCDRENPTGLDRLLVVTFTEAAAGEMRRKIAAALRDLLSATPHDAALRRQLVLVDHAQISTIHAFCNTLVRRHFHALGIDPEAAVMDEQDAALLRSEVMDQVVEDALRDDPDLRFADWLDSFSGADPTRGARPLILRLHAFMRSLARPGNWARDVRAEYPIDETGRGVVRPFESHAWVRPWADHLALRLEALWASARKGHAEAEGLHEKLAAWAAPLVEGLRAARLACRARQWEKAIEAVRAVDLGGFPRIAKPEPDLAALRDAMKALQNGFGGLAADLCFASARAMAEAHAAGASATHMLLDVCERFALAYDEAKRRRRALDFADLEHLAFRLLCQADPGGDAPPVPSEIARLCQDQYDYVLVDEYQDTSPIQEAILSLVSRRHDAARPSNLFAVGDVKQSIYAFRLAAPELFLEKYRRYPSVGQAPEGLAGDTRPEALGRRVDLSVNFRSRAQVLDAVNALFEPVMRGEAAGMDYDRKAALVAGADYPSATRNGENYDAEVLLVEADAPQQSDDEDASECRPIEMEAAHIGRRIMELTGRWQGKPLYVLDRSGLHEEGAEPALRAARFGDIVILLRAAAGRAEVYSRVLSAMGIPVYADLGAGFFQAQEVRDLVCLLQTIDNPLQDIPLAATLRSPLVGWSDADLLAARRAACGEAFYQGIRRLAQGGEARNLAERAARFVERLEVWRTQARRGPLADLVALLIHETAYDLHVLQSPDAAARRARLERMHELAGRFDHFSRQGLGRFLRFIERLEANESDLGEPSSAGEGENVVRIMTVHKSKGLEFPVVFVADMGKRFRRGGPSDGAMFSRSAPYLGTRVADVERGTTYPGPAYCVARIEQRRRDLAEEMRVLYVALTRAREKLILTGCIDKPERKWPDWAEAAWHGTALSQDALLGAGSYLDWVMPVLVRGGWQEPGKPCRIAIATATKNEAVFIGEVRPGGPIPAKPLADVAPDNEDARQLDAPKRSGEAHEMLARAAWQYPHGALTRAPARVSATELKGLMHTGNEEGERDFALFERSDAFAYPRAAGGELAVRPTDRGSWTHLVLQHLPLGDDLGDYATVSRHVEDMLSAGLLFEEQRQALDLESICWFFQSEIGRRMLGVPPDRVWRELPFVLGVAPSRAGFPDLADYDETERVRAQGVIDCLFQEGDRLILVDYKTDAVRGEAIGERAEAYLPQMWLYSRAVSAIFQQPLREAWLAFLSPRRAVRIETEALDELEETFHG